MNNKTTQFYELHYRTGKIVCNVQKSSESEFWTAHGRAELEQDHTYYCKPISIAGKFTSEEDAKRELIQLAKKWIETMTEL